MKKSYNYVPIKTEYKYSITIKSRSKSSNMKRKVKCLYNIQKEKKNQVTIYY